MTTCFPLVTNYSEISNNKYIFTNSFNINYSTTISYGLYDTSINKNYVINNVSINYPLAFFDNNNKSDLSNIITVEPLNKNNAIIIYVSKGQDYSFNNNDFFRFYDTSFQLLNINHSRNTTYNTTLTSIDNNFYFMNKQRYKFIATTDFCSNQPFIIGEYSLNNIGASFEIVIEPTTNNSSNKLFYRDNDNDISGNLFILRDASYSYYYGDISFSITNYRDFSTTKISIKSYDFGYGSIYNASYGNVSISNNDLFYYSETCSYVTRGYSSVSFELLNKITAIDLSIGTNTFSAGFNKNRHLNNSNFKYDLNYGLSIKDYHIIDISKNYPLRLENSFNSVNASNIYIDENYQSYRLGTISIGGLTYYYGSLKLKVVGAFLPTNVKFISISNNLIDSSYIVSFVYDTTQIALRHIVYDNSSNSKSSYDFSNTILQVKTLSGDYYNPSSYDLQSNKFILNLNIDYSELGYISRDRLNNDLKQFVLITPPIDEINNELSTNFLNKPFYIYYNVTDYEDNTIQNIRGIILNAGPIIEISNNYNRVNNKIFDFSINTNSNAASYNFYDDIKVYIYDKSKNKLFIPFDITISGSYFTNVNNRTSLSNDYILTTRLAQLTIPIRQNNYYSTFINNFELFDDKKLTLKNIEPLSITTISSNNSSVFLSFLRDFSYIYSETSGSIVINRNNSPASFNFNITNSFNNLFTVYSFNLISNLTTSINNIDVSLGLNSTQFFYSARDNLGNSVTVSGNFIKPKFFREPTDPINPKLIDLSYIGNYDLTISTKNLGSNDNYFLEYSGNFFNQSINNISETYSIRVADRIPPTLKFYDISGKILTNLPYFKHFFTNTNKFYLYTDICLIRLSSFIALSNEYVDNKPVLLYSDNSIYDLCINFLDISTNPKDGITVLNNEISLNTFNDISYIINYRIRDLCYNYSDFITLELNFVNIPDVTLNGSSIIVLNYVNNLTYIDNGLKFYISNSGTNREYKSAISYSKTNSSVVDVSNFNFNPTITYNITERATDICFSKLGTYYFKYSIIQTAPTGFVYSPVYLQRLIKIVDISSPWIYFPTITLPIESSNGVFSQNYDPNVRSIKYSIDSSSTNIDLCFNFTARTSEFIASTAFADISRVLYNFDLCDNYFNTNDLSLVITLNTLTTPFALSDISQAYYYSVTYPRTSLNYAEPLRFKYTITDGNNNVFRFIRNVNIVDYNTPSINFGFSNYYSNFGAYHYYKDYSYVQFSNFNSDFSYLAFNYLKSGTGPLEFDFNQEISSILFNFTLNDNFAINQNNFIITLSSSLLPAQIINRTTYTTNISFKSLFSKIGSSFSLIYDISDNQNIPSQFIRNVKIVDYISDNSRNFEYGYKNPLTYTTICDEIISFGTTNFDIVRDISIVNNRLTRFDISYDISYMFIANISTINTRSTFINSISGITPKLYDPSALIYNLGSQSILPYYTHHIKYFPIALSVAPFNTNYKILSVTVKNYGPQISFPPNNADLSHQSYTTITDASLLFGVSSISIYDVFYYYNYFTSISYSGTNFKVLLDSSLNVNDPKSGTYSLIYESRDKNNVDVSLIRRIIVSDSQAPFIRTICGDNIYELSNGTWRVNYDTPYIEYGAIVYDSASKNMIAIDGKIGSIINISGNSYNPYRLHQGILYSISYRVSTPTNTFVSISYELINTRLTDICYQVIYSIFDLCSNTTVENRLIKIVRNKKPLLYPYIEIDISTSTQKTTSIYYLLRDLSNQDKPVTRINALIPRFNPYGVVDISYDLSLVFINSNNNKIITCEALKSIVFVKARNANYIKFKLHATSYDGSRNSYNSLTNSSIITRVDYSINSLNVWNSPIDFQVITFYAIDNCQNVVEQENRTTFYLKIIDTKPPNVTKLTNINFSDPNILNYPLLSSSAITALINNLNYYDTYENSYLNYIRYYKVIRTGSQDASRIMLIDPGIMIDDIVDGTANYINDVLSGGSNFMLSDISVTYFKNPSYIDVSNLLTISGQYIQNYSVKDRANNKTDVSRVIIVKSFPPIIKLNYQRDSNGNIYTKYLTQTYDKYIEPSGGYVRDYKDTIMYFDDVAIDYSNLNESNNGLYVVNYTISNSMNIVGRAQRNVEVYSPIVLKKDLCNNFVELLTNSSTFNNTTKFSLANGSYKFYVAFNYAFTIVAQDFDTSKNSYDISNLISINSDLSAVANNEKYYYNNVNLTINGDFERCSIKFKDISNISSPFKDYLIAKIFRNFFIYDNLNYFVNLQTYYASLQDFSINIDASFQIDVANINNSASRPYFIIDGVRKDLYLSYGVYRFHQSTYKNFYNRIRFSITPDGTHSGGIEYTKTVFLKNLPGVSRLSNNLNIYTQITINATTPPILYYYSENFRNMGGKIVLKNNIVFLKNTLILNSFVLTNYTDNKFTTNNKFLGISNEIMRNRIVLNQRFDVSLNSANVNGANVNTISNINICCITQQNIKNNIVYGLNKHPHKLIFQKYDNSYNSTINTIASSSYLLDVSSASEFNASYKSYITYFNTTYESSYSLINKPQLNTYDKSLKNVFYYNPNNESVNNESVNNEILNYIHFFKSNNVIPSELLVKDFSYAISEFLFAKQSELLNLDSSNVYNYSSNTSSYLLAPRIKITNIIDNYVMFSLDVKYKNLHFQTFDFLIYSSNFTSFPNSSDTISMDRLFFINGSLVIATNMLYSNSITISGANDGFYDGSSIFNSIYPSEINKTNILQNMIFLNINETEISNNAVCGITKQNLYNNMYLDENNNFIFHKYNELTVVNYQVNDANLTLEKTLKENSNNQLHLIDVCANIFYNSFNNDALTIDALKDLSNNKNYSIALTYKIYNELDVSINFNILTSLYIDPLYINDVPLYRFIDSLYNRSVPNFRRTDNIYDICYNYNITANTSLSTTRYGVYTNSLHSNSYTINLQDYFDINLVNNRFQSTQFSTNIINPDNLIYTLVDMSYSNKNFSLFDLDASFNIIYDKFNITILNSMQIKLFSLYYKLQYLINLLNVPYSIKYNLNSIPYTTTINIQFYAEDFDDYDYINKSSTSKLSTSNINNLYYEILTNTVGFINTYNNLINYFRLFIYSVITLNPVYNDFTFNALVITQLIFDINKLIENVDTIILNEQLKFAYDLTKPVSPIFTSYSDISNIEYVFTTFFDTYNISQTYIKSFNTLKSQNFISAETISSELLNISSFKNLFERINLEPVNLLENLKINLGELNTRINTLAFNLAPLNVVNEIFVINIIDISNFNLLIFQYNRLKENINLLPNYRALEVENISYINNDFELLNSQILIHSKVSNTISLSFNVRYKSYFFYYIDLSTIILDVTIPDLTPPIVTFTNNDYSFNQTDLNTNSINSVLSNLISNVSYVDLNQSLNLTLNNTNYTYNQDVTNLVSTNAISYPLLSIDLTNINNRLEFDSKNTVLVDIYYIIKDNANNVNTIIRKLIINKSDDGPIFYYKISENEYVPIVNILPPLTIDEDKNVGQLIAALINNIYIIEPRKVRESSLLSNPVLTASQFIIMYNQAQVNLSIVEIFDLSDNKIDTYNVVTNQYTNFFNTTNSNGQLLANSSKMFLTVAVGRYTLKYKSVASVITGYITNKTRVLTINAVNVIVETPLVTHCCYPRVEYKPIQDNYKLGSQNSSVMRFAKYIVNRNR